MSTPDPPEGLSSAASRPLVEARDLRKHYPARRGLFGGVRTWIRAVDGVSFTIAAGETLGLVGETGSGKSTLGRLVVRLVEPTAGDVLFEGRSLLALGGRDLRATRRRMQIVFQDPYGSLDPRMRIAQIVGEGLDIHRIGSSIERRRRIDELLRIVGLSPDAADHYPHEFSGGQRQRISIARALALEPQFLVADEPLSALDVSVQAQIVNLLVDLRARFRLTMLFISHDLRVVGYLCERVAIMYLGKIVEVGSRDRIFTNPLHPYTRELLAAVPIADPGRRRPQRMGLRADASVSIGVPEGCAFHPRCPHAEDVCRRRSPPLTGGKNGHVVACHVFPADEPTA